LAFKNRFWLAFLRLKKRHEKTSDIKSHWFAIF
jgi:hypothetical protein